MAIPSTYPGVVALGHLCDLVGGDDTTRGFLPRRPPARHLPAGGSLHSDATRHAHGMAPDAVLGQDARHGIGRSWIVHRARGLRCRSDRAVLGPGRHRHRLDGRPEHRPILCPPPGPRRRLGGDQRPRRRSGWPRPKPPCAPRGSAQSASPGRWTARRRWHCSRTGRWRRSVASTSSSAPSAVPHTRSPSMPSARSSCSRPSGSTPGRPLP